MTEATETLNDRLRRLQADVGERRRRVTLLEGEERKARRAVRRASAGLEDYLRECEVNGVEPDPAREDELRRPIREAQSRVDWEPTTSPTGATVYEPRDREAMARLTGAREGLERAERELEAFARGNDVALARERLPWRVKERDDLLDAARRFLAFEARWNDGVREETGAAHLAGRAAPEFDDPPQSAMVELSRWVRRVEADPARALPLPAAAREAV